MQVGQAIADDEEVNIEFLPSADRKIEMGTGEGSSPLGLRRLEASEPNHWLKCQISRGQLGMLIS